MDHIILVSCQKVLTLGSCFKCESDGSVESWYDGRFQRGIVHMETEVGLHFKHVHHLGTRKYQVCVWYSCCHQKILGHGTQWLWSRQIVRVCSMSLPSQRRWRRRLHLFPRRQRVLRGCQQFVQYLYILQAVCPSRVDETSSSQPERISSSGRGKGRRVDIIPCWTGCITSGTTRSDSAGTSSGSMTSGVPAGRALSCIFIFSECPRAP